MASSLHFCHLPATCGLGFPWSRRIPCRQSHGGDFPPSGQSPGGDGHADHADERGTVEVSLLHVLCHIKKKQQR
jgi:hypothetical protein